MSETKPVTIIPACYLHGREWYNTDTEEYFQPTKPVYVRINGQRREAKRWLWLWRIVANIQGVLE